MKSFISLDFIFVLIGGFWLMSGWDKTAVINICFFLILAFGYLSLDFLIDKKTKLKDRYLLGKEILLYLIILFVFASTLGSNISDRLTDPTIQIHDGALQVEEATKLLVKGVNPYGYDYSDTNFGISAAQILTTLNVPVSNPAIFHLPYMPFNILVSVPFYLSSQYLFEGFDQRMVYVTAFVIFLICLRLLSSTREKALILIAAVSLNPFFTQFFVSGYNDILTASMILVTMLFLKRDHILLSSIFLAFAIASKHTALFFVPFYFGYIYFKKPSFELTAKKTWLLPVVLFIMVAPFFFWSPKTFMDDLSGFLSGSIQGSYIINGYSVPMVLHKIGLIRDINDYFPTWIIQIPLVGFATYILLKRQKEDNTLPRIIFNYAVVLLLFLFFSRFFHDNYLSFVAELFMIAYFL